MTNSLESGCYHCAGQLPKKVIAHVNIIINGEKKQVCCHGCKAVAHALLEKKIEIDGNVSQCLEASHKKKYFPFSFYALSSVIAFSLILLILIISRG